MMKTCLIKNNFKKKYNEQRDKGNFSTGLTTLLKKFEKKEEEVENYKVLKWSNLSNMEGITYTYINKFHRFLNNCQFQSGLCVM